MFDKNTTIGLTLIFAILIGFSIYNSPSEEELARQKFLKDSLSQVESKKTKSTENKIVDTIKNNVNNVVSDSTSTVELNSKYGIFAAAMQGENKLYSVSTSTIEAEFSSKGAIPTSVSLKNYKDSKGNKLYLIKDNNHAFSLTFPYNNQVIRTDSLYFEKVNSTSKNEISFRASLSENKFIQFNYKFNEKDYLFNLNYTLFGFDKIIPANTNQIELEMAISALQHEKSRTSESAATSIYYSLMDGEVDYLSESSDDKQTIQGKIKWVSFKQQYFSYVIGSDKGFDNPTDLEVKVFNDSSQYTKEMKALFTIPFKHNASENNTFSIYAGPNHFQTLQSYNLGLEKQINLGWGIVRWVNQYAVIPIFNFLKGLDLNMGIVILLMTLILKTVLFPLTFKAYLSSAKMKVLKPEIDELNIKYEKEDPLKKQQAMMSLYKKAGVNPLGGCVPMLLQLPILLAMFRFFPASIELRQEAFLWADDLSSYDSILTLPFTIPVYGNHVSLFTLLMTISTIIYTRMNSSQFSGNAQMEQMKWIMYLMPVLFMFTLNSFSSGLSYYYFVANMVTFGIQYAMKLSVNEEKIHKQIQENKKKPESNKKSRWQAKLEEIQKQQALASKQQATKKNKK